MINAFTDCITLVGLGGVGGPVALQIARLIPLFHVKRLILYDFDTVEERNLEGQIYTREDVEHLKVSAIGRHLYGIPMGDCIVEYRNERVDEHTPLRGIVIVAVDNLKTRKQIYHALDYRRGKNNIVPLLIEARIGDNYGIVFILDPNDKDQMAAYKKQVFWEEDASAPDDRCVPARIGAVFGGAMAEILVKFWKNWRPLKIKMGIVDFGDFPSVSFIDL